MPDFSLSDIAAQTLEPITINHSAHRRTSTSLNADNAIDDPARTLAGVGLTHAATLTHVVHRHGLDLPPPTPWPLKPGLAWLARKWLGRTSRIMGPADMVPKRMRGLCGFTVTYKTIAMFGYFLVCLQYCITE
jgi:hypothetical protein